MDNNTLALLRFQHELQIFETIASSFYGAIIWDWILVIPAEVKHIFWPEAVALFQRGKVPSIPSILLLLSRLLVIPMVVTSRLLILGQPSNCQATLRAIVVLYSLATVNSSAIFITRTMAVRNSKWMLISILWTWWLLTSITWGYWATLLTITQFVKYNPYTPVCHKMENLPLWTSALYLNQAIFDLLILYLTLETQIKKPKDILTLYSTWRVVSTGTKGDIRQIFFVDSVLYFAFSFTCSLIEAYWNFHHRRDTFYASALAPIHIWLSITIAPRVIRNLKLHSAQHHSSLSQHRTSPSISESKGLESQNEPCLTAASDSLVITTHSNQDGTQFESFIMSGSSPNPNHPFSHAFHHSPHKNDDLVHPFSSP